ncbi:MAG: glycosyltransferase family 4 protein [Hyphomicrobium sp.]
MRRRFAMKHVWLLNHYAQEPGSPGGTRHYALAKALTAHGWRMSIIAASTEHKTRRQRLADGETSRLQMVDGVPFLWLKARLYAGNGADRVRNMMDYTARVLQARNTAALDRPDAIIGSSVHPFAAWAGRRLARRFKVPFLFEVRDLWPQTLIDMGRLKSSSPAAYAMRRLELSLANDAARLIVLMPSADTYYAAHGVDVGKIVWIPNGADLSLFPEPAPPAPHDDVFTLMYFGAHGEANGLDTLLDAMKLVAARNLTPRIRLRLIGDGPEKARLMARAAGDAMSCVTFEDAVPRHEIPPLAASADAFVFHLLDLPVFKYGISSNKLFDFMAAGRPIVFACGSSNNPVAQAEAGITVPPMDAARMADAIARLAAMPPDQRHRMGLSGRRHVEQNYAVETLAKTLAGTLNTCCEARR